MKQTILIVDDSLTVRMDLIEAFEAEGYRCVGCSTVSQAKLALARDPIDLAILDVILPDGDGVELLTEIRHTTALAHLPVLMLSSEGEVKDRIRGLKTGANEYVGKPYDRMYVVARAGELLQSKGSDESIVTTILVIDDSETFREQFREALESAEYRVLIASTGEEGLTMAALHRPSAVLVDSVLPGIDGATVIRRIRLDSVLRSTPCVLVTASEEVGAELRAFEAGADAFLRKNEERTVMLARLRAVLRSGGSLSRLGMTPSLLGPKKILAVDDSVTYSNEIASALRTEGYDVVLAQSGEEALEMLAVQPVDCVLLDLVMPGLSGRETCQRIKSAPMVRDIPVIILTALEDSEAMIEGLGTGADDYIQKSTEFEVLRARVRAQMRRKQFEDENRRIREELLRKEMEALEASSAKQVAETRAALVTELELKNQELEAFVYSVSHDLRAPLRAIHGFTKMLEEDHAEQLDQQARELLDRVQRAANRMSELIEDMLTLSRVSRADLNRIPVSLTDIAQSLIDDLKQKEPGRQVAWLVEHGLTAEVDPRLIRIALENLLSNAWKYTAKVQDARIEFRKEDRDDQIVYAIQDNGAGFDMGAARNLFRPFHRLHSESEFPGTGIGLATVQRVINRHHGEVWADSVVGQGTTIRFTLPT